MSTTSHAVQGSQPGSSLQDRPRPPPIPKPKTSKHNLTNRLLQESFEVDYYLLRTGNWEHIKMAAVVQIFKTCCSGPLREHSSEMEPAIKGFKHQSERLKDKIYEGFIENLKIINLGEDYREVLFDILESTSKERWFFVWIVGQILRAWQKKEESASRKSESSKRERRDPLAIGERK
ncbi:hypothetical protein TWF102_006957 [Orbilia oligospora]|uniref:Uncharacterized protein n=1 Tax=Orbilia oligospora TaxID=2813651 RepID=A0A7C8JFU7_ORBOL|nr:hypothetical protein TWF103_005830 [Orbilia oligospora]KAF3111284.1 hypothetical protein TWF102_006957 [Orbilia oligospora]